MPELSGSAGRGMEELAILTTVQMRVRTPSDSIHHYTKLIMPYYTSTSFFHASEPH